MDRWTVPFLGVVTWLLMVLAKSTEVCYCGPSCCSVPRLCGKVLKQFSRLLVVLTMLTVCCVCVNSNTVKSADDEACHGDTISPRNAFFLSGENLTLVCNVQRGSPWGLTFVRGIFAEEVPSKYIQSLNATAIQLVIPNITDEDIRNNNASMQYKCMKEGSNGTCVDVLYVELDYYTVTPQNVSCRIFDFNTMNCSWDLVVKYVHEEDYDVICEVADLKDDEVKAVFLSDISKVENFTGEKCPNQSHTSCYWDEARYPAPAVIKLKITVNNTRRNIHKDTGWITFQEYDIVEPDPVKHLRVEDKGTPGCVIIHWEPSTGCKNKNMTFRLIHSSPCSDLQERKNVEGVNNMTVCGLVPYTNYTFSVASHVLDPMDLDIENGHWSKWNTIYYMTQSAEIETNLTIFPGLYELSNSTSQDGQMSLKLYWNPLSKCDLHSPSDSVTYTVQWNNLTKTVYHPSFMADILIPNLSALNVSVSTTNNVGSNAKRQILQVYAYGPEPTELVLEINKTSDKCVVYTSLLVGEKGPRYTDVRHTLVWCNKTELYCSAPLLWIDLSRNVTNFTFPRNQCEEQRYGLVTYGNDKGQGHTVNTGIHWEPCIYQRGKVPKKPLEDVTMSEIQPDGGFHVTWKRYDCKVSKAYIEHYTVRYCKDNGLCKCKIFGTSKQDPVYVNISRTSDSYTVENLEAGTQVCVWVAGFSKSGLGPFNNLPLTITIKKKSDSVGLIVGCLLAFLVGLVAMAFVIWRIRRTYKHYLKRTRITLSSSYSDIPNPKPTSLPTPTPLPTPDDTPDKPLLDYKVPDNIDDSDNTSIDSEEPISSYGQVHYMTESTSLETDEPDVNINWNDTIPYVTYCANPINDAANDNFISSGLGTSFQTGDTSVQNNHIQGISFNSSENISSNGVCETQGAMNSPKGDDFDLTNGIIRYESRKDPLTTISNNNNNIETAIQNKVDEEVKAETHHGDHDEYSISQSDHSEPIDEFNSVDCSDTWLSSHNDMNSPSLRACSKISQNQRAKDVDPGYVLDATNPSSSLRTTESAREHVNGNKTVEEEVIDHNYVLGTENRGLSLRTSDKAKEHESSNNTEEEEFINPGNVFDKENPGFNLRTTYTASEHVSSNNTAVVLDPGYVLDTENPGLSLRTTNTAREHVSSNNTAVVIDPGYVLDTENPGLRLQTADTGTDGCQHERDIDDVVSVMEQVSVDNQENVSEDASSVDVSEEEKYKDDMKNVSDSNGIGENDLSDGNIEGHNSLVTVSSDNSSRVYNHEPLELENNQDDFAQTHNTRMIEINNESETDWSERRMNENADEALTQNQGNDLISLMNQDDEAIDDTDGIPNLILGNDTELIGEYRSISSIGAVFLPGTDSSVTISSDYSSALSDNDSQPSQDDVVQTNEMNIGGENENETDSGASSFTNAASCSSLSDHGGNNSLQTRNSQDEVVQTDELNLRGENENEADSGASSSPNAASSSSISDHKSNIESEHPTDYMRATVIF